MEPREMVAALRDRDPDALRVLYDTYAESLFQFCWLVLHSRDAAQAAVGDALAFARENIDQVGDPDRLRPWLYSLARAECRSRGTVQPADDDELPAPPDEPDADRRNMAWNTVAGMSQDHAEILDLEIRHGMAPPEIAFALGVSEQEALEMAEAARSELRDCLGAHLVIRRGNPDCQGRAAALRGWTGSMTAFRARVLEHARGCEACGRHLPGAVFPARVYGYLPVVASGPRSRAEMLGRLTGERSPAGASARAATAPGARHGSRAARQRAVRMRIVVGAAAAVAAAAAAAALMLAGLPGPGGGRGQVPAVGRTGHGPPVTRFASTTPGTPAPVR